MKKDYRYRWTHLRQMVVAEKIHHFASAVPRARELYLKACVRTFSVQLLYTRVLYPNVNVRQSSSSQERTACVRKDEYRRTSCTEVLEVLGV